MTPYDYLLKYRNLAVDLVNGIRIFGIDVHEYRNARDVFDNNGKDDISADHDAAAGWDEAWSKLRAKIAKHGKKVAAGRYQLWLPLATDKDPEPIQIEEYAETPLLATAFTGKGKPETIAQVLRLAAAFGLVEPTAAAMNDYCTKYIGLDCNGFVGNYLRAVGSTTAGPSTPANTFVPTARRLSKLEDVTYHSVLCWKNAGHVAIIDHMQALQYNAKSIHCMVCESTGARLDSNDVHTDGLNYTAYEIHAPENKVFKVKRGIGGSKLNSVYIGNML